MNDDTQKTKSDTVVETDSGNPDAALEAERKAAEDWRQKYLRALADYQNLEKRMAAARTQSEQYAAQSVVTRLLPVIDVFESVHAHLRDQGLELALRQLQVLLDQLGVKKIDPKGKPFDPTSMDCIAVGEGPDGIVSEVLTPGYEMYGKLIREAKVKVGKQAETKKSKE